jgi:DNA-binding transcriptional LysR family regulator
MHAAARMLNQTQPAVTRSLRELEHTLGTPLLVRGANGVVLTEMGKLFEPRMRLILAELRRAVDEINQVTQSTHGSVSFGCSLLPSCSILPTVIERFHEVLNKEARITMTEGQLSDLLPSLRLGRLDFFIGVTPPDLYLNEFIVEPLLTTAFCVIARKGHPLANSSSLHELRDAKWYLPMSEAGYYANLESQLFPEGRDSNISILFSDSLAIGEHLIINFDYLFIGPEMMFTQPHNEKAFCKVPVKEKLPDGTFSLIYSKKTAMTPVAKQLADEIRYQCKVCT